ncbi:MAG: 3'(2'),5'-bisphosphate nucleotidase CysQ [Devosiaceae bacterium]|nr:3'(2'),5'-bisphosphate nucleotidase CysQ [Devosiaceae bacterium]
MKKTSDYESDLELLRSNAVAAGIVALGYFQRDIKSWTKDNASPVTEADFLVDRLLYENLLSARPDYGWLSEESADDLIRLEKPRCFVIDPIDGTRAFMHGNDCWSISLAIVENGEAVAGVIFAPARNELYYAAKGHGAFINGERIVKKQRDDALIITAPLAVHKELELAGLNYIHGPELPSLAYRLVQVTTGKIDVAISRRGAQDWDIAAADIILSECGLNIDDVCLGKPKYNKTEIRHGALAVFSDIAIKASISEALIKIYGCPKADKNLEKTNE